MPALPCWETGDLQAVCTAFPCRSPGRGTGSSWSKKAVLLGCTALGTCPTGAVLRQMLAQPWPHRQGCCSCPQTVPVVFGKVNEQRVMEKAQRPLLCLGMLVWFALESRTRPHACRWLVRAVGEGAGVPRLLLCSRGGETSSSK